MQNIMPYKSKSSIINPVNRVLGGNNETGSHWADGSYCAHMMLVAISNCMVIESQSNPVIVLDHGGTD